MLLLIAMEKYSPVKELPEDIKALPRNETVCQFCGVSYLIHHEIKKLEEMIKSRNRELENANNRLEDLKRHKEMLEVEKQQLSEKFSASNKKISDLNSSLDASILEAVELRKSCDAFQHSLEEQREKFENQLQHTINRHQFTSVLSKLKDGLSTMKDVDKEIRHTLSNTSSEFETLCHHLLRESRLWDKQRKTDLKLQEGEIRSLKLKLEAETERFASYRQKAERMGSDLKQQLFLSEAKQQQLSTDLSSKLETLTIECKSKEETVKSLTRALAVLEKQIKSVKSEKHSETALKKQEIEHLRAEMMAFQEESHRAVNSSASALKKKIQEMEMMEHTHREQEKVLTSSLETNKERQREMEKSLEALKSKHASHLKQLAEQHEHDVTMLKNSLRKEMHAHKQAISNQKENLATITELKSSLETVQQDHKEMLQSLQNELRKEKSMHDIEMHRHLQQVKDLEHKLSRTQDTREELIAEEQRKLVELKAVLASKDNERMRVERKLQQAFDEIKVLQATVEKQCLERQQLVMNLKPHK